MKSVKYTSPSKPKPQARRMSFRESWKSDVEFKTFIDLSVKNSRIEYAAEPVGQFATGRAKYAVGIYSGDELVKTTTAMFIESGNSEVRVTSVPFMKNVKEVKTTNSFAESWLTPEKFKKWVNNCKYEDAVELDIDEISTCKFKSGRDRYNVRITTASGDLLFTTFAMFLADKYQGGERLLISTENLKEFSPY